jgi:oligopeptide transport system substrate-binding protein
MGFNQTKEPFTDKKVRDAFAYAFDAQTYCEVVRSGDCVPDNTWVPDGIPGQIDSDLYKFDPEKAKQALAESTYGSAAALPPIKLTFASSDPANQSRAEYYAQQIQQILGIEMTLDPVETTALSALRKSPETYPQACFTCQSWYQDYPDPQNWLSIYWASSGFAKRISYKNEEFDALVAQADAELDQAKRQQLYEQASEILLNDNPAPMMYHRANVFLVKPEISGYTPTSADVEWPGERGSISTIDVNR